MILDQEYQTWRELESGKVVSNDTWQPSGSHLLNDISADGNNSEQACGSGFVAVCRVIATHVVIERHTAQFGPLRRRPPASTASRRQGNLRQVTLVIVHLGRMQTGVRRGAL